MNDNTNPLVITADMREQRSDVCAYLEENRKVVIKYVDLSAGDYICGPGVAVERKEASDFINSIIDNRLFIQDDFGLEPLDAIGRLSLLEILEDRHGRKSSIFVSQLPVVSWHEVIGDPTIADAICDRIIHNAHRIELEGDSLRKIYQNN